MAESTPPTMEDNINAQKGGQGGSNPFENHENPYDPNAKEGENDDNITLSKKAFNERLARAGKDNAKTAAEKAVQDYIESEKAKKSEADKMAKLSDKERAEAEKQQLQDEIDRLKKERTISEMTVQARKQISEQGVGVDDGLLTLLITDEADTTNENIELYVKTVKNEAEKLYNKSRQSASFGSNVGNGGSGNISRAEALAERQKQQLNQTKKQGLFKRDND